ncbi:beta family protein [Rhizobium sp. CC-YZS058]|uniref:beta family protein n=1 Tax=Rhizobium sp. CC-YZS058 TaxID=3042153 RepID=UPI002B05EEEB|nr:hypothetical protein [Rhizobium sp. CC-YZS058]MEA3536993.1 hypothetical protein [Rhizobium sp. CC-YZS058]
MSHAMYYPCLSTKAFELLAYERASEDVKDRCFPVVTLTRHRNAESFAEAAAALLDALAGRGAIVDFDSTPAAITSAAEAEQERRRRSAELVRLGGVPIRERSERQLASDQRQRDRKEAFNTHLRMLADEVEGPLQWIRIVAGLDNLLPCIRMTTPEGIARQISVASELGRCAALRIRLKEPGEPTLFLRALPLIGYWPPAGMILLIDAGYVRNRVPANVDQISSFLAQVRQQMGQDFERLPVVVLSNSFPKDSLKDHPEEIIMDEISLHRLVGRSWSVGYGDYMSVAKRPPGSGSNGWYPHVDLVKPESWQVKLDLNKDDPQGFIRSSQALVRDPSWAGRERCWGTQVIEAVAGGNLRVGPTAFTVPGPWLSVRANQHLSRMARR